MDIFALIVVVLAVVIVVLGAKRVPQGSEYTIERFGRYTKTLHPGLNLICADDRYCGCQAQHDGTGNGCAVTRGDHQG